MTNLPPNPDSRSDRRPNPGLPAWVKVAGIIVIILIVLFVALHLAGGGFHHAPIFQVWIPQP
jgi:hypothetical protein